MLPELSSQCSCPLASIVISVFRRSAYLAQAIQGALNQTWPNIEVIVTEDGGSECAAPIVASFGQPATRLRLVRHDHNLGAAANKLAAWRTARGAFLANLDDDDLLLPAFVESLIAPLIKDPTLVLSFCDHYLVDAQGQINEEATEENSHIYKRDILTPGVHRPFFELGLVDRSIPFAVGALWSRSRLDLDRFRTESGPSYDLYMTYVAARTGLGACYVPQRLTKYRVHPLMETRVGRERIHRANIFCNRTFSSDSVLKPWRRVFAARLADDHAGLGVLSLRQGSRRRAAIHFGLSLWHRLTSRALAGLAYSLLPQGPRRVY